MAGMARKVLSAGTLTDPGKLTALIDAIKKSVVLNQNWDIFGFARQMKGLTGGQLEFRTIPVENVEYKTRRRRRDQGRPGRGEGLRAGAGRAAAG